EGDGDESVRQRLERVRVLGLAACGDGRERAAVEGACCGNDLERAIAVACAPFPGQLDGRFIRFRARVAEEDARGERELDQAPGQVDLRLREIEIGRVDQRAGLCADRADHVRMRVPEQVDRDSCDEVEILPTR